MAEEDHTNTDVDTNALLLVSIAWIGCIIGLQVLPFKKKYLVSIMCNLYEK